MALRVLLADESTTIKKVMQLALQDFAVEVKAVHVGLDVVEVARQFKPDIIFADVLLQKKNGYEVSGELKRDPELRAIPIVLMWSSFMDLDEDLARDSGADRRLEKPFDIENLRQVLLELVPRTHTQRLAHFLKFPASFTEPMRKEAAAAPPPASIPKMPPIPASAPAAPIAMSPPPAPPTALPIVTPIASPAPTIEAPEPLEAADKSFVTSAWSMESFSDINEMDSSTSKSDTRNEHKLSVAPSPTSKAAPEDDDDDDDDDEGFAEFRIQNTQTSETAQNRQPAATNMENTGLSVLRPPTDDAPDEAWSHQDLGRFKLDLPPVTASNPEHGIDFELHDENQPPELELTAANLHSTTPRGPATDQRREEDTFAYAGVAEFNNADEYTPLPLPNARPVSGANDNDLVLQPDEIGRAGEFPQAPGELSLEPDRPAYAPAGHHEDFPVAEVGRIPQLSPDRLEEIIRSQSREIIESVVRRIVPDLATDIIREELQRLLEDSSARETRR